MVSGVHSRSWQGMTCGNFKSTAEYKTAQVALINSWSIWMNIYIRWGCGLQVKVPDIIVKSKGTSVSFMPQHFSKKFVVASFLEPGILVLCLLRLLSYWPLTSLIPFRPAWMELYEASTGLCAIATSLSLDTCFEDFTRSRIIKMIGGIFYIQISNYSFVLP